MKPVNLQDIINEMEMQMDEYHTYLNTETGEIINVSSEELRIAEESEEDDDFSKYPEWQRDSINEAVDVLINWDSDKYIELPDKWDIHEYSIMEAFCGSVRNYRISNVPFSAIKSTKRIKFFLGVLSSDGFNKLDAFINEECPFSVLKQCGSGEKGIVVFIASHVSEGDKISEKLGELSFTHCPFDYEITAAQKVSQLEATITDIIKEDEREFYSIIIRKCHQVCATLLPAGELTILLIDEDGAITSL